MSGRILASIGVTGLGSISKLAGLAMAALFAVSLLIAPTTASAADEYPTPTTQTVTGNATITGTASDPTLTAASSGSADVWYGVTVDLCSNGNGVYCSMNSSILYQYFDAPLTVNYSITATNTGNNGQSFAELEIYDVTNSPGFSDSRGCSYDEDGSSCGMTGPVSASYDYHYGICTGGGNCASQTTAYVHIDVLATGDGTFAQVDPSFTFNTSSPNYAAFHALYPNATITATSLAISAAPEPSSWLLMIGGIGGVGAWMRRRKALPSFARPSHA